MVQKTIQIILASLLFCILPLKSAPLQNSTELDSLFKILPTDAHKAESTLSFIKNKITLADNTQKLGYLLKLCNYYEQSEMHDSAIICINQGLKLAEKLNEKYYISAFNLNYAIIDIALANYSEAFEKIVKAKEIYHNKDSTRYLSDIYRVSGNAYWGMAIYEKALDNYFKSLDLARKEGLKRNIAAAYNNMGLIYQAINDTINLKKYFWLAFNLSNEIGDKWLAAVSSNNIGDYFHGRGVYDSALYYFEFSGTIARELGGKLHEGITLFNRGDAYLELGQIQKARIFLNESLELAYQTDDKIGISNCLLALGKSYILEFKPDEAIGLIDSGLSVAKSIHSYNLQSLAYSLKTEYYRQKNDVSKGFESLRNLMSIKDSLYEKENAEIITRMEYKYLEEQNALEIAGLMKQRKFTSILIILVSSALVIIILIILFFLSKSRAKNKLLSEKNLEIEAQQQLLHQKNSELTASQKELQELVYGKDRFITILSHDLKNPVSAIRGYVELMIKEFDDLSNDKKILFLKQIFESIENTSLLINNILYWVKSQNKGLQSNKTEINLHSQVRHNLSLYHIIAKDKKIKIINEIAPEIVLNVDSNIFDTIIRNLLSNSIKFTHKDGSIVFTAKENSDSIELIISDDGIGMTEEKLIEIQSNNDLYSAPGTKHEHGTGLGLNLVKEFCQIMNAELTIESVPDKGSDFKIKFSKDK